MIENKVSAFPHQYGGGDYEPVFSEGLTKRELFAAMAMQGIVSRGDGVSIDEEAGRRSIYGHFSFAAVQLADALIAELEKKN